MMVVFIHAPLENHMSIYCYFILYIFLFLDVFFIIIYCCVQSICFDFFSNADKFTIYKIYALSTSLYKRDELFF